MTKKPRLSFWQIWNMSFGFLGIQFGFALQNANVSRIFETLGAAVDKIPILWIAAPVTGLIVQPIIGHYSDRTWTKLGRRRPYFLIGAIFASIALLIMPNSPALWVAAGMLWVMDASINISMEPFRAFVGDMLPDEQRTTGFAMQSFFIGIGAYIASWLPYALTNWLNVPTTAPPGEIPPSVKMSFYIGAAVFFLAVLWTVLRSKEYSPGELQEFEEKDELKQKREIAEEQILTSPSVFFMKGLIWLLVGVLLSFPVFFFKLEAELYIVSLGLAFYGILQVISGMFLKVKGKANGLVTIINDVYLMPLTMKQLAIVQFFSWFALFAMWIYTTSAVTSHIYGTRDPSSALYNEGANWVAGMFGNYNLFAAIFAFLLPVLAKLSSRKITHMISLLCGGIGLISFYYIGNPKLLTLSMLGVGLAWSSILSMPYAILTGSLPMKKMGIYMGIFNFFIVIPQILAASILGFVTRNIFGNETIFALVLGGFSMILAGILVMFVNDIKRN